MKVWQTNCLGDWTVRSPVAEKMYISQISVSRAVVVEPHLLMYVPGLVTVLYQEPQASSR
jgi:hypothetical protein